MDLLLRNARLLGSDGVVDVAITGGRITALDADSVGPGRFRPLHPSGAVARLAGRPQGPDPPGLDRDVENVVVAEQAGVAQQQVHASAVFRSVGAITRSGTC